MLFGNQMRLTLFSVESDSFWGYNNFLTYARERWTFWHRGGQFGTKKTSRSPSDYWRFVSRLFLGYLSLVSRSLVGGGMGGDVTTVGVVFMRGGRAQKSGKH